MYHDKQIADYIYYTCIMDQTGRPNFMDQVVYIM